ncbi:HEAT repeat domain-containing protein [Streptomyces sp. H10-C2]|uniref:HEAT repeat domain-containing protein n=1 Tax=unclassified Streptomyces TaxID=2593676 RepID=UPI0024BAE276|nr:MULTISPECIES: HEAT repeat domain-containing protein [unclassified Streptomyces]MDJ0344181.1 HEAT repeat domain-containing protein [Streptomyces sp. PH10-H1]MDJ0373060.1 HEAT repeat domain-containing protein [Streptomyces sp. H10-C2]
MFDPDIAPSGTLLGLLQRGRGDGTLHALAAQRADALAALEQCILRDPRLDWRVESRSLYYARLYSELEAGLDGIEQHLFHPDDLLTPDEHRCGLALSVLGHLAGYGRGDALRLLRRYAATGGNWEWALDELAVRDDEEGLRGLGPALLARFPETAEGDAELAAAVREAYEPRPWQLWAEDLRHPVTAARVRKALEDVSFGRWQRQLRPTGPAPGWSVRAVLAWADEGLSQYPAVYRDQPAARCLAAVAGPEDRPELIAAAQDGPAAARAAALRHLADRQDPQALDLIEAASASQVELVVRAARESFERMRGTDAMDRARVWSDREDALGVSAARMLACRGGDEDAGRVLAGLRRLVQSDGADAEGLAILVEGAGRLSIGRSAPVLRHVYRETSSSQLRGCAAQSLAATDPGFAAGFAVECLWDCEETTRELAANEAATGDVRVLAQLRRMAADPAEEAEVQTAVRGRLSSGEPAR